MYAIVETGGFQFKVEKNTKVRLPKFDAEKDSVVKIDTVLMIKDNGTVLIGKPYIKDACVEGKVLGHGKAEKIIVFKYKKRKKYRRKKGHRQQYTEILITDIKPPETAENTEKKTQRISEENDLK